MMLSYRVLVERSRFGLLSALLLPGLLVVGCVSLTKPSEVERCSATSTCTDDPNQISPAGDAAKDSAKDDTVDNPGPDLALGQDKPILNPDGGSDVPSTVPDGSVDNGGSAPDSKDAAAGDVRDASSVFDTVTPPVDGAIDNAPSAEPGPELPGAEPSSGPEPGPEPGLEPQPELGPEPPPEPPRDGGGPETTPVSNCSIFYGSSPSTGSSGHPPTTNSTAAFCVATCDDIAGWGCSNDTGRTYTVNGTTVACGAAITKKNGYYVFQVSAGSNTTAAIYWWVTGSSWASSCPAPDGGVFP